MSQQQQQQQEEEIIKPLENSKLFLCGDLCEGSIDKLIRENKIKTYLYLNEDTNKYSPRARIESINAENNAEEEVKVKYRAIPINGENLDTKLANDLQSYMRDEFETPAVIQCSTATRAGIPYLLHVADSMKLTFETVMMIARENNLSLITRPNFVEFLRAQITDNNKTNKSSHVVFRQMFEKESSTYTYLIGCGRTKECVLIDPVLETVERDLECIDELGLTLTMCINTHCHADHITGSGEIKKLRPKCESVISKRAGALGDILIDDGHVIECGESIKLKCLATPGHTNGCMSFVLNDNTDVFTGDALLIRGCGRTDFQGGSSETLYDSVVTGLFARLPDSCKVWPAHDYKGKSMSTIGEEKTNNPRLGMKKTKEEFVQIMSELKLAYPKKIDASLPRNLKCGAE